MAKASAPLRRIRLRTTGPSLKQPTCQQGGPYVFPRDPAPFEEARQRGFGGGDPARRKPLAQLQQRLVALFLEGRHHLAAARLEPPELHVTARRLRRDAWASDHGRGPAERAARGSDAVHAPAEWPVSDPWAGTGVKGADRVPRRSGRASRSRTATTPRCRSRCSGSPARRSAPPAQHGCCGRRAPPGWGRSCR